MDKIGDFITRIRNAGNARQSTAVVPYGRMLADIAGILEREGYIASVEQKDIKGKPYLVVGIRYDENGTSVVHGSTRISKLSRRVYTGAKDIRPVRHSYGTMVLSTSQGVVTGEQAQESNVGGEILFEIW